MLIKYYFQRVLLVGLQVYHACSLRARVIGNYGILCYFSVKANKIKITLLMLSSWFELLVINEIKSQSTGISSSSIALDSLVHFDLLKRDKL